MRPKTLDHHLSVMYDSIVDSLKVERITPALILLHSAFDTVGWLGSAERYATRQSFCNWLDQYVLGAGKFECTSMDLYAARCGLLHTNSPDSKSFHNGHAKRIHWAYGNASLGNLKHSVSRLGIGSTTVAVHLDQLIEGWRLGVLSFMNDLDSNDQLSLQADAKVRSFFTEVPRSVMAKFVESTSDTDVG